MQRDLTEKWGAFYQSMIKPYSELTELNLKALERWSKACSADCFDMFLQARNPEAIISAQMELGKTARLVATDYVQEASRIYLKAASEIGKVFTEMAHEATKAAQSSFKTGSKKE